jgi:XRE family aerobic/anaerobic benzoate catabolism transcriptional regulator
MSSDKEQIALVGMMAVGKTTVGRMLASRLGWTFWDNDEALLEATGSTAAQVQRAEGQDGLHRHENELLRSALGEGRRTVFAVAASVVFDPDALTGVTTVWLRATTAREVANIMLSGQYHRPLGDHPLAELRRLEAERRRLYAQLATITVDVAADPGATCDRVMAALEARSAADQPQ